MNANVSVWDDFTYAEQPFVNPSTYSAIQPTYTNHNPQPYINHSTYSGPQPPYSGPQSPYINHSAPQPYINHSTYSAPQPYINHPGPQPYVNHSTHSAPNHSVPQQGLQPHINYSTHSAPQPYINHSGPQLYIIGSTYSGPQPHINDSTHSAPQPYINHSDPQPYIHPAGPQPDINHSTYSDLQPYISHSGPQPYINNSTSAGLQPYINHSTYANQGFSGSQPFINPVFASTQQPYTGSPMIHMVYGSGTFQEFPSTWSQHPAKGQKSDTAEQSSGVPSTSTLGIEKCMDADDILKRFKLFKQFDIVADHGDHHYSSHRSNQPPKQWAKKIQDEWRIMENDLPDSIYVRAYESRMDLLRAVIVGAEGTPYHDGLFFFDILFPSGYPDVPPLVYYHSGGLRLNPNLYECGKVCLSLLNTWHGSHHTEQWIPGFSTMLQVLVSIQALILNAKPYFNEPGYDEMSGSIHQERESQQYNENTFVLSLKTMVYTIRRRPKHFEDFVVGHFLERAQDILLSCKAYIEGAQVGSLARGGVQDVDASNKSCSPHFKNTVASCIPLLVQALSEMGAKDCDKFLPLANSYSVDVPTSSSYLYNAADYDDDAESYSDYSDY